MIDRTVIYKALSKHLYNNFSVANSVAWENVDFDKAGRAVWLKEVFAPNDTEQFTIGSTGKIRDFGFYRINVYIPTGQGTFASNTYINELSQLYKHGIVLTKDNYDIIIDKATPNAGFESDGWWVTPFTIDWSCYMAIN